ncbi:unnamed protein product [Closterium sp. Yama58-4]|nr:unnamed protein product [Closterium sp. Yama58-4]
MSSRGNVSRLAPFISTAKAKAAPSFESTKKANPDGSESERSNTEATAKAKAARSSFPVIFRRVAAVPGDEMVSSQPSDEPFRIGKDQFWVVADNPVVPAKEALDSRTLGPVHVRDMVGRALYVVRSALDHEPIHNRGSFSTRGSLALPSRSLRGGLSLRGSRDTASHAHSASGLNTLYRSSGGTRCQ